MEYRKLSEIKLLENNPRIIKENQFKILCDSIKDNPLYFEARPIILSDRTGEFVVIAGNQRYRAAMHLKLDTVPTFLMQGLSEEKEKEIVIRDNISNGEWDWDILSSEAWGDQKELLEWGLDVWQPEDEQNEDNANEVKTKSSEFKIEISCSSEQEQKKLYNELVDRGIECRI